MIMEIAYMYLIKKVINNNVILVYNEAQQEVVIIGKGIGFNYKAGQNYHCSESDELFIKPHDHDIYNFLDNIPIDIIKLTLEVINKCKPILNTELSDSLVITLSEHITFAIERSKSKEINISLYEVPYLYHLEFIAGKVSVDYINEKLGINLPPNEASLIALHFVNAKLNNKSVGDTLRFTQIVYKIVNIINYSFHIQLNTNSDSFSRFINHLRYLLIRCQANHDKSSKFNTVLEQLVEKELLKNFACAKKIAALIQSEYDFPVSREEIIYLALHIERLLNTV
ncbi:PRD domain-containing protein [Proteus mirabilis]|nr:PRD domain-containing protein [Proteus mirabilis]